MRLFLIICFALVFSIPSSYAQEDALPEVSENEEAAIESVSNENNVFDSASDEQIVEAQRFFRYCSKNKTLSKEKDCRCAATNYLQTRIRLGEDATPEQIMAENRNTCLTTVAEVIPDEGEVDVSKFSEKDIEEAEAVYVQCESTPKMSRAFDCECFASKYLDIRHDEGPLLSKDLIFLRLQTECKNLVESAGREYSLCMSSPTFADTNGIERKDFCECYARQWTRAYEGYTEVFDRKSRGFLKYSARSFCSNPQNYR